ncbi:MAG: DHH family phosphoesterase [Methanomassiliicoccales archaeon]|nr:DHH family phosphoesterase [Methanomassiliicoccales archaeon]
MADPTREENVKGLMDAAREAAQVLLGASSVTIVAHIDADGVSAASIASATLAKADVPSECRFIKKLDEAEVKLINQLHSEGVWLVDLGSSAISRITLPICCVSDHHSVIEDGSVSVKRKPGQNDLGSFMDRKVHVNPHLFGIDGGQSLSGAGATYLVAKSMSASNASLAPLAIVGAVGDFQDSANSRLVGLNQIIVQDAVAEGTIEVTKDIRIFGRESRPLARMLEYSNDPTLPGLTNRYSECKRFLDDIGIEQQSEIGWRSWVDLAPEEKRQVASRLAERLMDCGKGVRSIRRLIGEVYLLAEEEKGTPLHDAKEFATLLNSCGRYEKAGIGLKICQGDRGDALRIADELLRNHRDTLKNGIAWVKKKGVVRRQSLQYFHAEQQIPETVVGIVAGMLLGSADLSEDRNQERPEIDFKVDGSVPIIAFATSVDEESIKVSARATRELVLKGLDLSIAIRLASERVGGSGGGHRIAAGASIPLGKEQEFLDAIEALIAAQLGRNCPNASE